MKVASASHLTEARKLFQKATEEFERAKEKNDPFLLRDACAKGWLSAVEGAHALLVKKGIKEKELPKVDRGRGYMVSKHAPREIRLYYFALRDRLHIEGYYDGSLDFEEVEKYLQDLNSYIQKVEGFLI